MTLELNTSAMEREQALERLMALLHADGGMELDSSVRADASNAGLRQLSRLRTARARWVLATTHDMERVSEGAWLRRRHLA